MCRSLTLPVLVRAPFENYGKLHTVVEIIWKGGLVSLVSLMSCYTYLVGA